MKLRYGFIILSAITILFLPSFSFAQSRAQREAAVDDDPLQHSLPPGIRVRAFIHTPRVVEPNHLGTCTETTINSANFEKTGWHIPAGGITWKLNESTVPASVGASAARAAIISSFDAWFTADSGKAFHDGGKTTIKATKFDGTNAILWKKLSPSTIGVTYVWSYTTTGEVAEVDTAFNSRYPWRIFNDTADCSTIFDAYDLQNIATHEFGHWIGLDDLYDGVDKDLTMYGFGAGGELKKRTLGEGDINGANSVAP